MKNIELTIAKDNFKAFVIEFTKLSSLSKKMNLSIPSYKITSEEKKEVSIYAKIETGHGSAASKVDKYLIDVINVTVTIADMIKFNGWSLQATVHHREDIVDLIDVEVSIPAKYGVNFTTCEHCYHSHSNRVTSFVVKHDNGDYKQVGSTCVDKFLGINPNQLHKLSAQLVFVLKEFNFDEDGEEKCFGGRDMGWVQKRKAYDFREILQLAFVTLSNNDFLYIKKETRQSDSYPYETYRTNEGESTVEKMEEILYSDDYIAHRIDEDYFGELICFLTKMTVENPIGHDGEESFKQKIKNLQDATMIRGIDIWQAVWAILIYRKAQESASKGNDFIGKVGEKSVIECKIVDFKEGYGNFGDWQLFIMEDKDGNSINKWGALGNQYIVEQPNESYIGTTIRATAMIKAHDTRDSRNTTILGRLSKAK